MAYDPLSYFPSLNVGERLGALPDVYEEARIREARKRAFAGLDFGSSKSIFDAARKAGLAGLPEDALKLVQFGTGRLSAEAAMKGAEQRGADIELWREMIKSGRLPGYGGAAAPPEVPMGIIGGGGPAPSVPAPPTRSLPGLPGIGGIGPGASLPPSPGEELLARAEGPPPVQQEPVRLAGPLPAPPATAGPPPMESPGPVPFVPQAQVPAGAPSVGMPTKTPSQEAAREAELRIGSQTVQLPPRSQSWPLYRANMAALQNALAQQKATPAQTEWALSQAQRNWAGLPLQRIDEYQAWKDNLKPNHAAALKDYGETINTGKSATETLNVLDRMDQIAADPNFFSGTGTGRYRQFISGMNTLAGAVNVDLQQFPAFQNAVKVMSSPVSNHVKAVALQEAYDSLAGRAVFEMAGGNFSRGFSEGDRVYMANILGSSANTPQGLKAIRGQLRGIAEYNKGLADVSNKYMTENEKSGTATPWGLEIAKEKYRNENPLFTTRDAQGNLVLTERAKKLNANLGIGPSGTEAPPTPAPPPIRQGDPGRRVKGPKGELLWELPDGQLVPRDAI